MAFMGYFYDALDRQEQFYWLNFITILFLGRDLLFLFQLVFKVRFNLIKYIVYIAASPDAFTETFD